MKKQPKRTDRPGVDRYGRTLLHHAALNGDLPQLQTLLAAGAAVNVADDDGWTPLHFAAQTSSLPVAAALLRAGAAIDPRDAHGNTPLFKAVFQCRGDGALIALLRAHGADPFAVNRHGQSPVGLARLIANFDTARFFADLPSD